MTTLMSWLQEIERTFEFINEPLEPKIRKAFLRVAREGWFLGPGMAPRVIAQSASAIESGNINSIDEYFAGYYEKHAEELCTNLYVWHPRRIQIISKTWKAHTQRDYELSVPIFLAQADGICQELTGFELFGKNGPEPRTAAYVRRFKGTPFRLTLLEPFLHLLPISASTRNGSSKKLLLNRHAILHGESTDYGTRINSVKAFALLYYAAWVFRPQIISV